MSTRANIVVTDNGEISTGIWFYRHSDGDPDGTLPSLKRLMEKVKDKTIRPNPMQAIGWLIVEGIVEYFTSGEPGDIEFLYVLDLKNLTISYYQDGKPVVVKI